MMLLLLLLLLHRLLGGRCRRAHKLLHVVQHIVAEVTSAVIIQRTRLPLRRCIPITTG